MTRSPGWSVVSIEPDGTQYGFATKLSTSPVTTNAAAIWNHVLPTMRRHRAFVAGRASERSVVSATLHGTRWGDRVSHGGAHPLRRAHGRPPRHRPWGRRVGEA